MRDAALRCGFSEADGKTALRDKETANLARSDRSSTILEDYGQILKACNAIDFDDQIAVACHVLDNRPEVLNAYQLAARHLLVDEYQDINADQHRLITILTKGQETGLFAVGDDDQSIYGFRGGDPAYIRSFTDDYPTGQRLQLKVSRRCRKNILDGALSVVERYDPERVAKGRPEYLQEDEGEVHVWNCPSEKREAVLISKAIYAKLADRTATNVFILVLSKNYVAPIVAELNARGIACDVGTADAPHSEWQFLTVLKDWLDTPTNLITRHAIELMVLGRQTAMPSERVRAADKRAAREACAKEIAELWDDVIDSGGTLMDGLTACQGRESYVGEVAGHSSRLAAAYKSGDAASYLSAVRDAVGVFANVDAFYNCLARLHAADAGRQNVDAAVRILTYQSSKGLEADCVFVVGAEEETMPSEPSNERQTAEQARLFFVAMTRAKNELHLTHARTRTGAATYKLKSRELKASCFIEGLPKGQSKRHFIRSESASKRRKQ